MPIIICSIELFERNASIWIQGDSWGISLEVFLDDLVERLKELSKTYETNKIKIFGSKDYAQKIVEELNQNNEYEIEVN